ncbi:ABC transporter permease [Citricoccus nitrophenolicus]|uniref:Peptide/nickel transport system permease protein n=1 Tax=Citricoccus muralis TaxID=169134 RepID=A0A3D9LJ27_9MICC|nr:ABC transporter permease [Citricoccus muralis]REE05063.1 peptide/nickel transport system permease protein [Citricoccus muralis]
MTTQPQTQPRITADAGTTGAVPAAPHPAGPASSAAWRRVPTTVWIAGVFAGLLVLAAFAPGVLATHDPRAITLEAPLAPPGWEHWFGTDQSGRDLYSRIVHGTAQSLLIGLGAAAVGVGLAVVFGSWAALGGRWADTVIGRGIEVLFAFPILLLAMVFIAVYGPSVQTLILAVGLGIAPGYARMVRAQVMSVRRSGYVQAAQALGHHPGRVLTQHILPNALRPLLAVLTLGIGQSIVWASGLAFLGFGVAPPSPEWGALLEAGRPYIIEAWWLEIIPGLAVLATALTATVLGKFVESTLEGER